MPAVIVVGGHRCGTSSIAGAIERLGVPTALPGDSIGPSPSNPRGHFEDATLCRLHQRLLGPAGWRDPRPVSVVPLQWQTLYDAHLARRAAAAHRFGIKDPRLCFLLPVLLGRLRMQTIDVHIVSVTRATNAVAESLRRRQRMSVESALRIAWLYDGARRAQVARLLFEGIPVLELQYERALDDRAAAVTHLAEFIGVAPTPAAIEFLDPALRHL